ncbi:hypothetical protein [Piscinibacter sakaiensis]
MSTTAQTPAGAEGPVPGLEPGPGLGLAVATDLQDHLLMASNDLERLHTLLADACDTLMQRFTDASQHIGALMDRPADDTTRAGYQRLMQDLGGAVTALQFQDMASQLIHHTHHRLRSCADVLAREVFGADDEGGVLVEAPPQRPNPVTQAEMDAGSIELF